MDLYYKLLGLTSKVSHSLSRIRINFVPINLALGCVVTILAFGSLAMVSEGTTNSQTPVKSTIADVIAGRNPQQFVTLTGELHPDAEFDEVRTSKRSGTTRTTARYFLLWDTEHHQGLFVQTSPDEDVGTEPHTFTTHGMVESTEGELAQQISSLSAKAEGKIDTAHLLKNGTKPAELAPAILFFVLSGLGTFLFWTSYFHKYVIFQPERSATSSAGDGNMIGTPIGSTTPMGMVVRGTGAFTLDTGAKQRFLSMPCATAELETGDAGFICNVDASSRFMGVTTTKRTGLWIMAVRRDGSVQCVPGQQYLGWNADPAVRIDFTDTLTGMRQSGILSFESAADRDAMIRYLSSPGVPAPPVYTGPPPSGPAPTDAL